MQELKVTWKNVKFGIDRIDETFTEKIWVDDKNHPEGGSYQNVVKYYESPMAMIHFEGEVEGVPLTPGAVYSNGYINLVAVSSSRITTTEAVVPVEKFELSDVLVMVSQGFFREF